MPISTPNHIPEIPGVLDDLAERLEPLVEPLKFWLLQRPNQEGRPSGRGEIYLALESVRYQDRRTLEDNQQRAKTTIVLVFRYFDPRSQTAAYEVMSKCRKSLVGYRLPNSEPIQFGYFQILRIRRRRGLFLFPKLHRLSFKHHPILPKRRLEQIPHPGGLYKR